MKPALWFLLLCTTVAFAQPGKTLPRYNQVYSIATHNSYWVKRAKVHELFATGTQERLMDQLLFDQVRTLEIDIHKTRGKKGEWQVYHTGGHKNVFFHDLTDFLKQLQQFDYFLPEHEVVTVVLELKEIFAHNFDKNHTPADLDKLLKQYLGDKLFTPQHLMQRCPGATNLRDCAASTDTIWPTTQHLRGKFIFLVLGNFHVWPIGHGGAGWADYAVSDTPAAFPMLSDFSVFNKRGGEKVKPEKLAKAYSASVFQQVENLNDTAHLAEVSKFIAAGGIVRGGNSFSLAEQEARIKAGFHMLQTDYPWLHYGGKDLTQPFQPINPNKNFDTVAFIELGNRIVAQYTMGPDTTLSATDLGLGHRIPTTRALTTWDTLINGFTDWETLPAATRSSPDEAFVNPAREYGMGCLVAKGSLGAFCICRQTNKKQNAEISVSYGELTGSHTSTSNTHTFKSNLRTSGLAGDAIRLQIMPDSIGTGCTAYAYSSSEMLNSGQALWNLLYTQHFDIPLNKQGLIAAGGDVVFTGTKLNGKYIDAADLKKSNRLTFKNAAINNTYK